MLTVLALLSTPGPSQLLMLSNNGAHGFRRAVFTAEAAFWRQFLLLSATYLVMDGAFLSAYGLSASWIAARFKGAARVWIERIGGGFMIGAAVLLRLKSITER